MMATLDNLLKQGQRLPQNTVLSHITLEGQKEYHNLAYPNPKMEAWRFTNVSHLLKTNFSSARPEAENAQIPKLLQSSGLGTSKRLVIVNGEFSAKYSDLAGLPAGVEVATLGAAAEKYPRLIGNRLSGIVPVNNSTFVAANTAMLENGLFLRITKAAKLAFPLQLLYITIGDAGTYSTPRALVIVEDGAAVELIEQFSGEGSAAYFNNCVTEISLGESSSLIYYRLQGEAENANHIASLGFDQAEGSSLKAGIFDFGARLSRNDIVVNLLGAHCDTHLDGLQILSGSQHGDNHTLIRHTKPYCSSNELFKSILGGKARTVFNGRILVGEGAEGTDSVQTNRNLLLSENARVNSNPQLEIYTDNVKCSHGSATGQLDEDALFYFRSRGISQADAYTLMIRGFTHEILNKISIDAVRGHVESKLRFKLELMQGKDRVNG